MDWVEPAQLETPGRATLREPDHKLRELRRHIAELAAAACEQLTVGVWKPAWDLRVVALVGQLDSSSTALVHAAIESLAAPHSFCLIIDLSQLTFIDPAGLDALAQVARRIDERKGVMMLAAPTQSVAHLLRWAELDRMMVIATSLEVAVRQSGTSLVSPAR